MKKRIKLAEKEIKDPWWRGRGGEEGKIEGIFVRGREKVGLGKVGMDFVEGVVFEGGWSW